MDKRLPIDIVPKVWGKETWYVNNDMYCGKILSIQKNYFSSEHLHRDKVETFAVLSGHVMVVIFDKSGDKKFISMKKDDCLDIPACTVHQLRAIEDSEILEISTHHEDSDSYRVSKSGYQPTVTYEGDED